MSITTNKATKYHETDQDVKFKLKWLRLDGLDNLKSLSIRGGLSGKVGTATGEVDYKEASIGLQGIKDNCSESEKQTLKAAIALFERELGKAEDELAAETHDDTDVFVDNSGE